MQASLDLIGWIGIGGSGLGSNIGTVNSHQIHQRISIISPEPPVFLIDQSIGRRGTTVTPQSQYLEAISKEFSWFSRVGDQTGAGQYTIDHEKSLISLKLSILESFLLSRYGRASARIFRILWEKRNLEEKTISKMALSTAKETRERLYAMMQAGFVHIQEVPRTADHAPSRTIFLWTIRTPHAFDAFEGMLEKCLLNLYERIKAERARHTVLLVKAERSDVRSNPELLTSSE